MIHIVAGIGRYMQPIVALHALAATTNCSSGWAELLKRADLAQQANDLAELKRIVDAIFLLHDQISNTQH